MKIEIEIVKDTNKFLGDLVKGENMYWVALRTRHAYVKVKGRETVFQILNIQSHQKKKLLEHCQDYYQIIHDHIKAGL